MNNDTTGDLKELRDAPFYWDTAKICALSHLDTALQEMYDHPEDIRGLREAYKKCEHYRLRAQDGEVDRVVLETARETIAAFDDTGALSALNILNTAAMLIAANDLAEQLQALRNNARFLYHTSIAYKYYSDDYLR